VLVELYSEVGTSNGGLKYVKTAFVRQVRQEGISANLHSSRSSRWIQMHHALARLRPIVGRALGASEQNGLANISPPAYSRQSSVNPPQTAPEPTPAANQFRWFMEEVQPHDDQLKGYLHGAFPSVRDVDDVVQES
jgi:hypothetical protein